MGLKRWEKLLMTKKLKKLVLPKKFFLKDRRNFLKLLGTGTGGFLIGTLFGSELLPLLNLRGQDFQIGQEFKNFKVLEKNKGLVFVNKKTGKEILTITQDGGLEFR